MGLNDPILNSAYPIAGQGLTLDPSGRIPSAAAPVVAFTPAWASSGTQPALADAVVAVGYIKVGKLVYYTGQVTFGASTTFGTGTYSFSLPTPSSNGAFVPVGSVYAFDSSGSVFQMGFAISTGAAFNIQYSATWPTGTQAVYAQTVPWTWASGDIVAWNIVYQAAA